MPPTPSNPGKSPKPNPADLRPRIDELLIERAISGLQAAEEAELQLLLNELGKPLDESFDMAAAAADLAMMPPTTEAMPVTLRNRILAAGDQWLAQSEGRDHAADHRAIDVLAAIGHAEAINESGSYRFAPFAQKWGGWVAAAACLAVAAIAWSNRTGISQSADPPRVDGSNMAGVGGPIAPLIDKASDVVASALDELNKLREEQSSVVVPLSFAQANPKAVSDPNDASEMALAAQSGPPAPAGEVVWSGDRQEGFVRLSLPALEHPGDQYQLWISDALRDQQYPVPAGVFDVAPGQSEVVVRISTPLKIYYPTMFAVTIERAGGILVSNLDSVVVRGRLMPVDAADSISNSATGKGDSGGASIRSVESGN